MNQTVVHFLRYDATSIQELPAEIASPLIEAHKTNWFDVRGLADTVLVNRIGAHVNMHSLLIEDVLDIYQRPKVDEFEDALFVRATAYRFEDKIPKLHSEQLAFYLCPHTLVSFQEDIQDLYPEVRNRLKNIQSRLRLRGADYLLYVLLDELVDGYLQVLDTLEDQIALLESDIDRGSHARQKTRIYLFKRDISTLRRSVVPLREAVMRILRSGHPLLARENEMYYRDLYDHLNETVEQCDSFRDQLNSLHDLYNSEIGLKSNSIMRLLTIISTIFIPLTFIVGVYGMNFDHMPELHHPLGYFATWLVMLVIAGFMLLYFKRKLWL
jgi:magnesium transporter